MITELLDIIGCALVAAAVIMLAIYGRKGNEHHEVRL